MLDAGHGGSDPGAVRPTPDGMLREADLNLDITLKVAQFLQGHEVLFTRESDCFILPMGRVALEQASRVDCFISIHNNTGSDTAQGYQIYHATGSVKGKDLARCILDALDKANLGRLSCGMFPDTLTHHGRIAVLRDTFAPAALIECGFISNPEERAWLQVPDNRIRMAQGIAEGIKKWEHGEKLQGE
jgi:N-acetylmuramoyl-L-alanine amidase